MSTKLILLIFAGFLASASASPCVAANFGENSVVCVCNATYCDTLSPVQPLPAHQYQIYTSDRAGSRFAKTEGYFLPHAKDEPFLSTAFINLKSRFQSILGFGGTFTDASAINILSLDKATKDNLLRSYFSETGIQYTAGRIPIGCTEFSSHLYSYDDKVGDVELGDFKLTPEDTDYKIPLLREIQETFNNLSLVASAWTSPPWMKTNSAMDKPGLLVTSMYQSWVDYQLKFLEAYKDANISMWGITTGNRPNAGDETDGLPSLSWLVTQMSAWIAEHFGPTLRNSKFPDINILAVDDLHAYFPNFVDLLFSENPDAKKYVDGFGTHCDADDPTSQSVLGQTQMKFEDQYILSTSAISRSELESESVQLGNWDHADKYAEGMIATLNNWGIGWIDSNLALDSKGGPSLLKGSHVEAPIIVDSEHQVFYKQPSFYVQGHFSKFVPSGSTRVGIRKIFTDLTMVAFKRPDGGIVLIVHNNKTSEQTVRINDEQRGHIMFTATARSISTILYW